VELGWGEEHYPTYFNTITGSDWKLEDFWPISDRIYALMKLFWLREYPETDRSADYPPAAWFDPSNVDTEGPIAGMHLEYDKLHYDIVATGAACRGTRTSWARSGLEAPRAHDWSPE
jgi:aldehyde:ferredoxin oxidoreductase